jgi:glutamyl-tRNA synthetase
VWAQAQAQAPGRVRVRVREAASEAASEAAIDVASDAAREGDGVTGAAAPVRGTVRTRIAPSPTGFLHLGTARTALYSWAYARHHGGQFVLRIEDTDVARSTQESVGQILASMTWLDIDFDEGPIHQMQRLARYREVIDRLIAEDKAYRCWCTPDELDAMRDAQRARGDGKVLPGSGRQRPS